MEYSSEKIILEEIAINNCGSQPFKDCDYHTVRKRIDYTLMFISEGEATVHRNGKTYIARKGDVMFFPPDSQQDYEFFAKNKSVNKWIHFGGSICTVLDKYPNIISISNTYEFESNLDRLFDAYYRITEKNSLLCNGYMRVIIALLIDNYERQSKAMKGPKGKMPAVLDYISVHMGDKIDFDVCAEMCYLSRSRFNHFFKEYTGLSPHDYYLNLKIERAKQLLHDAGMTTSECAETLGFYDSNHFRRAFKSCTGMTPKQFLNKPTL